MSIPSFGKNNNKKNQPAFLPAVLASNFAVLLLGLSSLVDMSMTENSEENQISVIKTCIKNHVFSIWKFYQKDYHSHFSEDEKTLCGFIMKHTNIRGTQNWWLGMRRIVVKSHTDLRNNAIKNMQTKFKGEELK